MCEAGSCDLQDSTPWTCRRCQQDIAKFERYALAVGHEVYHVDCLLCSVCGRSLQPPERCWERNGKVFCERDYARQHGQLCSGCGDAIVPGSFARWAKNSAFHLTCFLCHDCGHSFSTGEQLLCRDGIMLCAKHLTKAKLEGQTAERAPAAPAAATKRTVSKRRPIKSQLKNLETEKQINIAQSPTNNPTVEDPLPLTSAVCSSSVNVAIATTAEQSASFSKLSSSTALSLATDSQDEQLHASKTEATSSLLTPGSSDEPESTSRHNECFPDTSSDSRRSHEGERTSPPSQSPPKSRKRKRSPSGKRQRTSFSDAQLQVLHSSFQQEQNPDSQALERVANICGLHRRVVQVWFQNARARHKKRLAPGDDDSAVARLRQQSDAATDLESLSGTGERCDSSVVLLSQTFTTSDNEGMAPS